MIAFRRLDNPITDRDGELKFELVGESRRVRNPRASQPLADFIQIQQRSHGKESCGECVPCRLGTKQMLDHFFVTERLLPSAKFDVVHLNVDFPRTFINLTASDHEPLVASPSEDGRNSSTS